MQPYNKTSEEIAQQLRTDLNQGLSSKEAASRLKKYGPNVLSKSLSKDSLWIIFFKQFKSSLIYVLLFAALLLLLKNEFLDAGIIVAILLFNALLGTIQEGRAQTILEGLRNYIQPTTSVIRDGISIIIPIGDVVIGDLLIVQEGQQIPADARIVQSYGLQIDESMLTGESQAIFKDEEPLSEDDLSITQQLNMLFKGTYVAVGNGLALVIATGDQTYLGSLKESVEKISTDFPLKKRLDHLSWIIIRVIFFICIALALIGIARGRSLSELFFTLAVLFVCVIPEGLPIVFTAALVRGARRMARNNLLVKKLQAVEALGTVNTIIIDKTGTLTRNEMVVSSIFMDDRLYEVTGEGYFLTGEVLYNDKPAADESLNFLSLVCDLLNRAVVMYDEKRKLFTIKGDPIDAALFILSKKIGVPDAIKNYHKIDSLPFDYKERIRAEFFSINDDVIAFVSGSPEGVLKRCSVKDDDINPVFTDFLQQGYKVIGLGYKKCTREFYNERFQQDPDFHKKFIDQELTILALIALQDAIRPEVKEVIKQSRDAGMRIIMATGDHEDTALYVAKKVGIFQEGDEIFSGINLKTISYNDFENKLPHITIFARVTPDQKLTIVEAYQQEGNIVAMTGDGINDAPALIAADAGISLGNIGTEIAKDASDIILLDDSFVSIVGAIKEGRHIFITLHRATLYFLTTNAGEVILIFLTLLFGLPLALEPVQILWLNLVTDTFLDISLVNEPYEEDLLKVSFVHRSLVDRSMIYRILSMSFPMALLSLLVFWYYSDNLVLARTMTLTTMALFQWFNVWNCRSERKSIFTLGLTTNSWLLMACSVVFILQLCVLYIPFMQKIFKTQPLTLNQLFVAALIASSIVIIEEIRKWMHNQYGSYQSVQ